MSRFEKTVLAAILLVAALVRLWDFTSYFPHFWDEAKYVEEIDGLIQFFSVNVLSYAFLKLGRAIIGPPSYPQIVTATAGVLTVFGLFVLGRCIFSGDRRGIRLGLLMAACAAVMPYYLLYSRHALAAGFALCFFVFALAAYVSKLQHPPVKSSRARMKYLRRSALGAFLIALVPACSFKYLVPTGILFVLMEVFIWRVRSAKQREYKPGQTLIATIIGGGLLFAWIPLAASILSGYTGWLDRAITLSAFHAQIKTLRPAFNFLYPVHLYYLAGPMLMACAVIGIVLMFLKSPADDSRSPDKATSVLLALGFAVYVGFFGAFSHLQSARLYALSLPFVVYAAALTILQSGRMLPRLGRFIVPAVAVLLVGSMARISIDYLSKTSVLPEASNAIVQHIKEDGTIYTNAKTQVYYCCSYSPYNAGYVVRLKSFLHSADIQLSRSNPPVMVIQDGVDLVSTVASHDKQDRLRVLDSIQARLNAYLKVEKYADLIYSGPENFFTSPYYYLEDVYSWRSYNYIRDLMPTRRDSIFIYLANPARFDNPAPTP